MPIQYSIDARERLLSAIDPAMRGPVWVAFVDARGVEVTRRERVALSLTVHPINHRGEHDPRYTIETTPPLNELAARIEPLQALLPLQLVFYRCADSDDWSAPLEDWFLKCPLVNGNEIEISLEHA